MKLCNYTHVVDNRNTYQTLMVAKVETIDMLAHGKIGGSQCMNLNAINNGQRAGRHSTLMSVIIYRNERLCAKA